MQYEKGRESTEYLRVSIGFETESNQTEYLRFESQFWQMQNLNDVGNVDHQIS